MNEIKTLPRSQIVEIARLAFATPDVDFLCFGESDQPSPDAAVSAGRGAIAAGETKYADVRGLPELRTALARYVSGLYAKPVAEGRILVTASGMAALSLALIGVVHPGERVLVHTPAWPNGANAARLAGAEVVALPLEALPDGHFGLDLDRLATLIAGARAFILNSPNNPTGWTARPEELARILDLCRKGGTWLIADEVYGRLIYDGSAAAPSLLDIAEPADRVIVCNSFSKTWIMTGWRLGWMVLPEGARDPMAELAEATHSGVAAFVQRAGLAVLDDPTVVERFRAFCARGRAMVGEILDGANAIRYAAPDAAFYAFVGVDQLTDSMAFARRLVSEHKVAVAPGSAFGEGGEGYLRLCFAQSPAHLERALKRLRAGLARVSAG